MLVRKRKHWDSTRDTSLLHCFIHIQLSRYLLLSTFASVSPVLVVAMHLRCAKDVCLSWLPVAKRMWESREWRKVRRKCKADFIVPTEGEGLDAGSSDPDHIDCGRYEYGTAAAATVGVRIGMFPGLALRGRNSSISPETHAKAQMQ